MSSTDKSKSHAKLDVYSAMIVSKYFKCEEDFRKIVQVCKKFSDLLDRFKFNPIDIESKKLFPNIQTQYMYTPEAKKLKSIEHYEYVVKTTDCTVETTESNVTYSNGVMFGVKDTLPACVTPTILKQGEGNQTLTSLSGLPTTLTRIASCAFEDNTSLSEIVIPKNIRVIGKCAFANTNAAVVDLGTSSVSVKERAFEGCKLTSLALSPYANIYEANPIDTQHVAVSVNGTCLYGRMPLKLATDLMKRGIKCYNISLAKEDIPIQSVHFEVPECVNILDMGCCACMYNLVSIVLPSKLEMIGDNAFIHCHMLKSVSLPNTVYWIGDSAFAYCKSLERVTIPSSVRIIPSGSFVGCNSLKVAKIPQNARIEPGAFPTTTRVDRYN